MMLIVMIPIRLRIILSLVIVTLLMGGCTFWGKKTPTDDTMMTGGGFPPSTGYPTGGGVSDTTVYHTVVKGDTLAAIGRRYGRSYQEIAQWNGLAPPYTIHPGQQLRISPNVSAMDSSYSTPMGTSTMGAMSSGNAYAFPVNQTPSLTVQPLDDEGQPLPFSVDPESASSGGQFHVVAPGESIHGIASRYGQRWQDVAAWNSLSPPYYPLPEGRKLQVTPPPGWGGRNVAGYNPPYASPVVNPYATTDYYDPTATPTTATRAISPGPSTRTTSGNSSYHTVQAGDTLYNVAKRYGRRAADVAAWNGFSAPYPPLQVGQTLVIKGSSRTKTATAVKPAVATATSSTGYHTVAPGDTLYNIAKRYGQSLAQLATMNNMSQPYPPISIGQRLQVAQGAGGSSSPSIRAYSSTGNSRVSPPRSSGTRSHQVKVGETLYSIARLYGVTAYDLSVWNGIGSPSTVYPGQTLRVVPP